MSDIPLNLARKNAAAPVLRDRLARRRREMADQEALAFVAMPRVAGEMALFEIPLRDLTAAHEQHKQGIDALMERLEKFTSPSEAPSPPRAAEDAREQGRRQ